MLVTGAYSEQELLRLQGYAKEFADTLRFLHTSEKFNGKYDVTYEIAVEEQNKIVEREKLIKVSEDIDKRISKPPMSNGLLFFFFFWFLFIIVLILFTFSN